MTDISNQIRTRKNPDCYICGARGELLYQHLRDHLFSILGEWDIKKCPNSRCGLVWLDPLPIEEDIGKAYSNYYTHNESVRGHVVYGKYRLFLKQLFGYFKQGYLAERYNYKDEINVIQKLLSYGLYIYPSLTKSLSRGVRYVKHVPKGKLLDVGCGNGSYIQYMQSLGWEVRGIDFDSEAVSNARSKGLNVNTGDLEQCLYLDNTFDVITINHVIEHVPKPLDLLQECRRILKRGGKLVIATPNAASWGHSLYGLDWRGLEPPRHLHIFTPVSLAYLIEQAGLQLGRLKTQAGSCSLFLASESIRAARNGNELDFDSRRLLSLRVKAHGLKIFEGLLNLIRKNAGQELILIVSKK